MLKGFAVAAGLFGLMTLASGGAVLFGGPAARIAAGAVMPFVLWFNTAAGIAYIVAAVGIWQGRAWSRMLAAVIAVATVLVLALFAVLAATGTPYEMRTLAALIFRSAFWGAVAVVLQRKAVPSQL